MRRRQLSKPCAKATILLCFTSLFAPAGDLALLIDVSGTMRQYGTWQGATENLVEAVLAGKSPDSEVWALTGDPRSLSAFRMQPGERIHLIRFGSIRQTAFPFFATPQTVNEVSGLAAIFPTEPLVYSESKTNKPLAIAVGSRVSSIGGTGRLIAVSDFMVDSNLMPAQQDYVNEFEAATRMESPVIFSWKQNSHVQVKLIHVAITTTTATTSTSASTDAKSTNGITLRLQSPTILKSPDRVQFRWVRQGGTTPRSYELTVRDAPSRKIEWQQRGLLSSSAVWNEPKSGKKLWQVKAVMDDGSEIMSTVVPLEIPGSSIGAIFMALLLLGAAGGTAYYLAGRRTRKGLSRSENA